MNKNKKKMPVWKVIFIVILVLFAILILINSGNYRAFRITIKNYLQHNDKAKIKWCITCPYGFKWSRIFIDNKLIFVSGDLYYCDVVCIDKFTSKKIWDFHYSVDPENCADSEITGHIELLKKDLILFTDRNSFSIRNISDGKPLLDLAFDSTIIQTNYKEDNNLIYVAIKKSFYTIDYALNKATKIFSFKKNITGIAHDRNLFFIAFEEGIIKNFDINTKKIENYIKIDMGKDNYLSIRFKNDILYADTEKYFFTIKDKKIIWKKSITTYNSRRYIYPILTNKYLVLGSYNDRLSIADSISGKFVANTPRFNYLNIDLLDKSNLIFLATSSDAGYFDIISQKYLWKISLPQNNSFIDSFYDEKSKTIYITIEYPSELKIDDLIYAVNAENGNILWKYTVIKDFNDFAVNDGTVYVLGSKYIMAICGKS